MADKPRNGVMLILLGGGLAVMTHLRPQGLNVPPVIMDALCLAIVSAGGAILLGASGRPRLRAWAMALCLITLTTGPAWIALGPGGRSCNAGTSAPFSAAVMSGREKVQGLGCRVAFGFGGLILAGMAVAAVVMAVRTRPTATT
ncbi:MAG: hypothetical protein CFE28_03230 [Alphaproteobacteria bacterium PA2]|nr:MAG: hypothetical protein CFE28_03230 [Alphaproteobacteria bacterium PA2]